MEESCNMTGKPLDMEWKVVEDTVKLGTGHLSILSAHRQNRTPSLVEIESRDLQ